MGRWVGNGQHVVAIFVRGVVGMEEKCVEVGIKRGGRWNQKSGMERSTKKAPACYCQCLEGGWETWSRGELEKLLIDIVETQTKILEDRSAE